MREHMTRYLISGGRKWSEPAKINAVVDAMDIYNDILIHGHCPTGADRLADQRAVDIGLSVILFPAKWGTYGEAAGNIRNQQMIDEGEPDFAYLFWDGRSPGTKDMLKRVISASIKHQVIPSRGCESYVHDRYYELSGKQLALF